MYNKFFLKYVKFFYKLVHFLTVIPFTWNPRTNMVEVKGTFGTAKSLVSLLNILLYSGALIPCNLAKAWKSKEFEDFNYTIVIWMGYWMGAVMMLLCFCNAEEVCLVFNGYYAFLLNFAGSNMKNFNPETWKGNQYFKMSLLISTLISVSLWLLFTGNYFLHPRTPPYITYLVPEYLMHPLIYYPVGLKFSLFAIGVTLLLALLNAHVLSFFFYLRPIYTIELKLDQEASVYKTKNSIRSLNTMVIYWRAINLMVNDVNRVFAITFIPLQGIFTYMTVFGNLVMIRYWGSMKLTAKLVLPIITLFAAFGWGVFLSLAGHIRMDSIKTLKSWRLERYRKRKDREYMKRFKLSCKPLCFGFGKQMKIKPKNVLGYLRRVSRSTLKMLIALRKINY